MFRLRREGGWRKEGWTRAQKSHSERRRNGEISGEGKGEVGGKRETLEVFVALDLWLNTGSKERLYR